MKSPCKAHSRRFGCMCQKRVGDVISNAKKLHFYNS